VKSKGYGTAKKRIKTEIIHNSPWDVPIGKKTYNNS
jgi:hypothetical protein